MVQHFCTYDKNSPYLVMPRYKRVFLPVQTFAHFFVMRYFEHIITGDEQRVWHAFQEVVTGFLGNRRADNYKDLVEELPSSYQKLGCNMSVKIHFVRSHLDSQNCGSVSDKHGERFHQDIAAMEGRYKGKWSPLVLADYCWTVMHDSPNSTFNQQAMKA